MAGCYLVGSLVLAGFAVMDPTFGWPAFLAANGAGPFDQFLGDAGLGRSY